MANGNDEQIKEKNMGCICKCRDIALKIMLVLMALIGATHNAEASQIVSSAEINRAASEAGISAGTNAYEALIRINSVYANQLSSSERTGKIVCLFEGVGATASTSKRRNAMCVVIDDGSIKYINRNCTTIPDYPFRKQSDNNKGTPTLKSGVLYFESWNHRNTYAALKAMGTSSSANVAVLRHTSNNADPVSDVSDAINVHRRTGDSLGSNYSLGCQLIGMVGTGANDDYARFIKAIGIVNSNATGLSKTTAGKYKGRLIIDRYYAYNYLRDIGYPEKSINLIAPEANYQPDRTPTRSFRTPLTCYAVSEGNIDTYTTPSGSEKAGYITGSTDECKITKVYENNRVEVIYPTSKGNKTAYAYLNDFIRNSQAVSNYSCKVSSNVDVYRRSDMKQTIGTAYSSDDILVVAEYDGKLQIIYPISGGYKLGWIDGKTPFEGEDSSGGGSSSTAVDSRYKTPIKTYTNSSGNIDTYNAVNGTKTGAIYTGDLCTVNEVYENGWCKVTYPTNNNNKTAFTKFSNFLDTSCQVTPGAFKPGQTLTVYRRKNLSETLGSVWSSDACTVVASSGNLRQIIYPLDAGGYKMGWVNLPTSPDPVGWPMPLKCYINDPSSRAAAYDSINGDSGYGQIFVDDLCVIDAVYTNNWVHVSYPTSSGSKSAYVPLSTFVPNKITAYKVTASKQVTSYRKSDMAEEYGYASKNDECVIVGKLNDKVQMIYPIPGGYKLAWAYASDFEKSLTSISITQKPEKTTYVEGESFSTSGLAVTAYYSDNSSRNVSGSVSCSGYSNTSGEKTITVSYSEGEVTKQAYFSVTVTAKKPTRLTIAKQPSRLTYLEGQTNFDFSDMVVNVTYNNGTNAAITNYEIFGLATTVGNHVITVKYTENGMTVNATFAITVKAKSLESICTVLVSEDVEGVTILFGNELDLSNIMLIGIYDNGDTEVISQYDTSGFDPYQTGWQTVTIMYNGLTTTQAVFVEMPEKNVVDDPDMVVPLELREIGDSAFSGGLFERVKLSEKVSIIGDYAFADCKKLGQIYIPESVDEISNTAFEGVDKNMIIYGVEGSFAEYYADRNGFNFISVNVN